MKRPLYKLDSEPKVVLARSHVGLWFDKFCNEWCEFEDKGRRQPWSLRSKQEENPKLAWIKSVIGERSGDFGLLKEHAARLAALAHALGGQSFHFKTTSRFATGLGREHPIENGFAWHPVLGTPYLPGSSVKGLVRAWVESGWSAETIDPPAFHRIFGSDYRAGSSRHDAQRGLAPQSGTVIFLDAIPAKPIQLKADVMTPHYGDYYEGARDQFCKPVPPADWLNPNPIPFLTVAPEQDFQFALAPRTPGDSADVSTAASWLEAALKWIGAGAKTAVGYGRFAKTDAAADASDRSQTLQSDGARSTAPQYKAGQHVVATRVDDPKRKGRVWFQADDGFGGVVTSGSSPSAEIGEIVELEIANVNQGLGYNFRLPKPASSPQTHKATRPRR
jgi:CRISPR-associated protein Cmr6